MITIPRTFSFTANTFFLFVLMMISLAFSSLCLRVSSFSSLNFLQQWFLQIFRHKKKGREDNLLYIQKSPVEGKLLFSLLLSILAKHLPPRFHRQDKGRPSRSSIKCTGSNRLMHKSMFVSGACKKTIQDYRGSAPDIFAK